MDLVDIPLPVIVGTPSPDGRPRVIDATGAVLCIVYSGGTELAEAIARKIAEVVAQRKNRVNEGKCALYEQHVFWMTSEPRLLRCDCGEEMVSEVG